MDQDREKRGSELVFGRCISCGKLAGAPLVKFPLSVPVMEKGKPGHYQIKYGPVCDECCMNWSKTYIEKVANGDFNPETTWLNEEQKQNLKRETQSLKNSLEEKD